MNIRQITGTEDIINKCCEYGLKTPEFYQEEDFRVVIWRVNGEDVPTGEDKLLEAIREKGVLIREGRNSGKWIINKM